MMNSEKVKNKDFIIIITALIGIIIQLNVMGFMLFCPNTSSDIFYSFQELIKNEVSGDE